MTSEMQHRPISEDYRLVSKEWVDADAAARLLEETKTSVLAQRMLACDESSMAKKEMVVKASPEWMEHLQKIVDAKTQANFLRCKLEYVRLRHAEQMSKEASNRAEMRL